MLITENELRIIIREILLERNQPNLLKKQLPYDLLIANLNSRIISEIYRDFQNKTLIDSFIDASTGSADVGYDDLDSLEEKAAALNESQFSLIKLKKNNKVIKHLKNIFGFNFANCNLNDNKPIFCIPANSLRGDSSNITSPALANKKISDLLKNQAIKDLEDWNWAAHDFHHGEIALATDGDQFIDSSKISGDRLIDYDAPRTGYEYMDSHANFNIYGSYKGYGPKPTIRDYWMKLIGFYFNKTGFTRGVANVDIWASVYSYCLTKMSRPEDAYKIDFTIVNEPGKRTLIAGKGEIKELQDFFANAYETVQKYSMLNNLEDGIIYIALMI